MTLSIIGRDGHRYQYEHVDTKSIEKVDLYSENPRMLFTCKKLDQDKVVELQLNNIILIEYFGTKKEEISK